MGNECYIQVTPFSLTVGTNVYTLPKIHQIILPSLMTMNLCTIEPVIAFHVTSIGVNVWECLHSVTTCAAQTLAL